MLDLLLFLDCALFVLWVVIWTEQCYCTELGTVFCYNLRWLSTSHTLVELRFQTSTTVKSFYTLFAHCSARKEGIETCTVKTGGKIVLPAQSVVGRYLFGNVLFAVGSTLFVNLFFSIL